MRYSSSQSVKSFNSIFNFLHRLSPPGSSPTNTRSQVTSRSTSEVGMIGLHDHTGSNNHSCVFTHPCPSSYGHGFSNIASLAQSNRAALDVRFFEQTDREESEPDQPIPGGELLVGCSMRRQIACTQLGLLSIILSGPTLPFSRRYCLVQYSPQNTQKPRRVAQYSSPSDSASSETLSRRR